jgi:chaperonin GroEL
MNETGYIPKELDFGSEGREKLITGITQIANAVKSTLGPRGNTVLIESPEHTASITVTKDGVTVAKAVELLDPVENLAVRIMKQAAERTATLAGDGTTTAIVLTEALVKNSTELLIKNPHVSVTEVIRALSKYTIDIINILKKESIKVTKKTLTNVATISANNDELVGDIISATYNAVGENGIVTVEKSQNSETYCETTEGIKIDRGYSSPLFINNQKKDECILENVHVLVSDAEISNVLNIENILKPIIQENKKLLIIAPCSTNVINTLAANVMKRGLKVCIIPPPSFGWKTNELMQDIAMSVGGTYFSEKTGDDLSIVNFSDLGRASKVIVGRDSTVVLCSPKDDEHVEQLKIRVDELKEAHKRAKTKPDREFILSRIASLTGGVGVIYVGGNTDLEQKELYDRVDDAVCAVRSALSDGILPGSGVALLNVVDELDKGKTESEKIAYAILSKSLSSPVRQILDNSGLKFDKIYNTAFKKGHGYNVVTEKTGKMIDLGVIDPTKVTVSALSNAISVANTILSTNAIITMARSYDKK